MLKTILIPKGAFFILITRLYLSFTPKKVVLGYRTLKHVEIKRTIHYTKVSLFPTSGSGLRGTRAPPELYADYVICVCPRLLLRSNLEQPTACHELNNVGK